MRCQLIQGRVDGQQLLVAGGHGFGGRIVQGDKHPPAPSPPRLRCMAAPGRFNQNLPHSAGGDALEVQGGLEG